MDFIQKSSFRYLVGKWRVGGDEIQNREELFTKPLEKVFLSDLFERILLILLLEHCL